MLSESESCSVMYNSLQPHKYTVHGILQARILEWVVIHSLLQGVFPTHESNPSLLHCSRILHQLSQQGNPRILEWVAYPFSRVSSWPRDRTRVSCLAGRFFISGAKLASASMFQKIGGNCPSVRFPHLETAHKILHIICMYVSMEVCRFSHPWPRERLRDHLL